MDAAEGTVVNENFLKEYVIRSLIIGLLFGIIMALYNRYKEKKRV